MRRDWLIAMRGQMSQKALGDLVGVSSQAVAAWEAGTKSPSRANAIALERVLGPEVHVHLTAEELAPPSGEEVA